MGSPDPSSRVVGLARFERLDTLGRGACGVVYRARDAVSGDEVAVKLIHPERTLRGVDELLAEATRLSDIGAVGLPDLVLVARLGVEVARSGADEAAAAAFEALATREQRKLEEAGADVA